MQIRIRDLYALSNEKNYIIDCKDIVIANNIYIRGIKKVEGEITFFRDDFASLQINYSLKGMIICPDALTLEDVEVPFVIDQQEEIVDDVEKEGFYLTRDLSLQDLLCQIVSPLAPIKVVKNKKIEYPKGDGWSFESEQDYELTKSQEIDPRWQKLKEYKAQED